MGSLLGYPIKAGISQSTTLANTFFLFYIGDLHEDVTCNVTIYTDDTTLYFKYDWASNIRSQLE